MKNIENYSLIAEAIVELFKPLVEVVIHDVAADKILYIQGGLSKRKIGDDSLLDRTLDIAESGVYSKINYDGRLLKSISVPLKEKEIVVALMCINFDISLLQSLGQFAALMQKDAIMKQPEALFKNDWQNKINEFIANELRINNLSFDRLTNRDKQEVIHKLYLSGGFAQKKSVDYIAKIMDMGRATVFNYLKKFKKDTTDVI